MRAVIAPKLAPAQALGSCAAAAPLAFTLLFSSVSAIAGFAGHANYCAGNAAADAAAAHDAARGLPALAVQWGAWSGVGEPTRRLDDILPNLPHSRECGCDCPIQRERLASISCILADLPCSS
jgi:hypothetical protein